MADYIDRSAAIEALRKFADDCPGSSEAATAAAMAISVLSRVRGPLVNAEERMPESSGLYLCEKGYLRDGLDTLDGVAGCAGGGKMSYNEALRIVTDYSVALSMGYALDKDCCIEYAEALRIVLQLAEQETI